MTDEERLIEVMERLIKALEEFNRPAIPYPMPPAIPVPPYVPHPPKVPYSPWRDPRPYPPYRPTWIYCAAAEE